VFGLVFNQNQNKIFADKNIRKALDLAAPREDIVDQSLKSFGEPVDGPLASQVADDKPLDARIVDAVENFGCRWLQNSV